MSSMPPADPSNFMNEGMSLLQQGNAREAAAVLQQATQADPSNGVAYQYLGVARTQSGDAEGGLSALREAARLLPANAGVRYNLGVALTQAQKTDEARAVLSEALQLDPTNVKAQAALDRLTPVVAAGYDISGLGGMSSPPAAPPPVPAGLGTLGNLAPPPLSQHPSPNTQHLTPPSPNYPITPSPTEGMAYTPPAAVMPQAFVREPTTGQRILRGLGWGALFGQWWTLMITLFDFIWGGAVQAGWSAATVVIMVVIAAVFFAVVGSVLGLIIGGIRADVGTGAIVGIVFGVLLLGGEYLLYHSATVIINILFWGFTGRFVGANIAAKVQEPIGV